MKFEEAREFLRKKKFKTTKEWNEYKKSKNFNYKIPLWPGGVTKIQVG